MSIKLSKIFNGTEHRISFKSDGKNIQSWDFHLNSEMKKTIELVDLQSALRSFNIVSSESRDAFYESLGAKDDADKTIVQVLALLITYGKFMDSLSPSETFDEHIAACFENHLKGHVLLDWVEISKDDGNQILLITDDELSEEVKSLYRKGFVGKISIGNSSHYWIESFDIERWNNPSDIKRKIIKLINRDLWERFGR